MIGVAVQPAEREATAEFFELCKTSWEFLQANRSYEIVLCSASPVPIAGTKLTIVYDGGGKSAGPGVSREEIAFIYRGQRVPIYGSIAAFPQSTETIALQEGTSSPIISAAAGDGRKLIRVGYDLFAEVALLIGRGQPAACAQIATLDFHAALLRDLIVRAGLPFIEIPPVPAGHAFAVCLTHDVDHPVLRNHLFDHTMFGFLQRATFGAVADWSRGRISAPRMLRNWGAAARLPFVYLGLARDFWGDFDRYLGLGAGRPSTFFVIPERDNPGRTREGKAPDMRASRYSLADIAPTLNRITAAGSAVGLHGLNAWLEADDARTERACLVKAMGTAPVDNGVRMHWLYFDKKSPAALDAAGFSYDSTVGYNETVGFRAGTTQVYRPPGVRNLLELPLHVMDTALFYPSHLHLSEEEADRLLTSIINVFARFGGTMTVNWHDRSIAPERQWDEFYQRLLEKLQALGAWFATAAQAVAWFKARRSAKLECSGLAADTLNVRATVTSLDSSLPGLRIRLHRPHLVAATEVLSSAPDTEYSDISFTETIDTTIKL